MTFPLEDVAKIVIAFIAGAILGFERETHSKPAGLRTLILITVGSTLFSILSTTLLHGTYDRIASNIVTGVGFVGGGVIFKEGASLKGITTAATIWAAAAIGMAIGFGQYWLAASAMLLVLLTLTVLAVVEERVDSKKMKRLYKITFDGNRYSLAELKQSLDRLEVHSTEKRLIKNEGQITVMYTIKAKKHGLHKVDDFLMHNECIKGFEV